MGKDLTEIAGLLIGVALVALLVMYAGNTSQIIGTSTSGFAGLLSTVEGQGGMMGGSSFIPQSFGYGGMIP